MSADSFWDKLPRPFLALAPMADVTDAAFRHIIARYGKPDVMWSEFVSADGLYHTREVERMPDADNPLMRDLAYTEAERPIVAQLFSSSPAMLAYGARVVAELGFDGVDINMGCPDRAIEKQHAGAALIKRPALARELIRAAVEGAGGLPVSVKTRIGYRTNELRTWLPELLAEAPAAITVHARTRLELSRVPARWEHIREAVALRDAFRERTGVEVRIIGNGDVLNRADGLQKASASGADGAMIGRAFFGTPWLLSEGEPTRTERLRILVEHCRAFEERCSHKPFAVMKKHFKAYVHGYPGAADLREKLYGCACADEVAGVLAADSFNSTH